MPVDLERFKFLLERYSNDTITATEFDELCEMAGVADGEALIKEQVMNAPIVLVDKAKMDKVLAKLLEKREAPVVPMYRRSIFKWVAAACIILVTGYGLWVTSERKATGQQGGEATAIHDVPAPSNTRAVITLADGSKVYLDSVNNGTIAQQNNVNVVKNEKGEIIYSPDHPITNHQITYNTLFNPRGSKVISLTLSDGTKVWLNSESSLRYPASFAPSAVNREVEITGEAFFEVKHNAKQPFKVHLPNGSIIEDIGTAFNVNAYTDEEAIKTTLIEGSVIVRRESSNVKLVPGQQAVLNQVNPKISRIEVQTNVDMDEVLAWKNGLFSSNNTDLRTVMRQVARWYDVDIVFEGKVNNEEFMGGVSRQENISALLKVLEATNKVHFKIEGKKITVLK
jgi:ferric-dicitrate binding protein FerR (iron transport regulator)